ncbi:MAG: hypothetical protein ACFCUT_14205 [Kiloniellaceae bacterium]
MADWKTLKLSELTLDQKNYRTGQQASQRKAIEAVIDDQKHLLVNLAKDLLEEGPSPGEPIWVTPDPDSPGMYVVLEGNRRVTALKLLEHPALAHKTVVESDFKTLSKQYAANPRRELEARVFASREAALPWIRRRHMASTSGVGLQPWKPMAKGRANREHGLSAPRSLAVVEFLEDDSEDWQNIAAALDVRWTTVDRVLNAKAMHQVLGVQIDPKKGIITFENGDIEAGKRLLGQILGKMASSTFDFSDIEKVGDRENFLKGFLSSAVKLRKGADKSRSSGTSKGACAEGASTSAPSATAAKGSKKKTDQADRPTLAPKSGHRTFQVDGIRLAAIYRECRTLLLKNNENAAALLLRVFIELSSEAYLSEKKIPLPTKASKLGKTNWSDIGISLAAKVACVADHLDPTKKAKDLQQARLAIHASAKSASSIETLHGYFHNRSLSPDAGLVRDAWDAWETYLRQLHAAR